MKLTRSPRIIVDESNQGYDYSMIELEIGGSVVSGRPYDFVDFNDGIAPTKIAVGCPNCGAGIFIDVEAGVTDFKKYFKKKPISCPDCKFGFSKDEPIPDDPFINPWDHQLIANFNMISRTIDKIIDE